MKIYVCMLVMLLALTACHHKSNNDNIIVPKENLKQKPTGPVRTGDASQTQTISWLGAKYKVQMVLKADPTLPLAHDGSHPYYDNRVTITVKRADGSTFFNRTFTKNDFKQYLPDNISRNGALLGVVYMQTKGDVLTFAASVGSPNSLSDEYVPLVVKVNRTGGVSISKDEQLDTVSDNAADEDDEE